MVAVVVFEFSVMRCQPLRRALCGSMWNRARCVSGFFRTNV
ncbi:acetyltransferase [Vibrio cholerae]|nr:acetyltransferase [Vibrio cholerae]RBM26439.1 acetyltransferase [Vibrio tarriae]